tara:strand:- start:40 stop:249 length:210 start_codon:yes stop_codon:yes gene_type:complete
MGRIYNLVNQANYRHALPIFHITSTYRGCPAVQGAGFGEVSAGLATAMLPEKFTTSEYLCSTFRAKREA